MSGEENKDVHMEDAENQEQDVFKVFSLDLLTLIKSAQNQNGLRHNDYGRYHQYCERKMYR